MSDTLEFKQQSIDDLKKHILHLYREMNYLIFDFENTLKKLVSQNNRSDTEMYLDDILIHSAIMMGNTAQLKHYVTSIIGAVEDYRILNHLTHAKK